MFLFADQTGRVIHLPAIPKNIVSVVPSQTELLFDLGLDKEVTGITKFCIHPSQWFTAKRRVGGTKDIRISEIETIAPDLIIANKEENRKEQVEELALHYPVWVSDVVNLSSAYAMIETLGNVTGKPERAATIVGSIKHQFQQLLAPVQRKKVVYLIWQNPLMTIGGDTFIHEMLHLAGFDNLFAHANRYPQITAEELKRLQPEVVLLSSEPFPFREKHIAYFRTIVPEAAIHLVNGEYFSWYGSRLQYAPQYFEAVRRLASIL